METQIKNGKHVWPKGKDLSFNLPLSLDPVVRKQRQSYFSTAEFSCKCRQPDSVCGTQEISVDLIDKLIKLREEYGSPMTISSGLRCMADHKRIYRQKGITDESKIPMNSRHLVVNGQAVDIADPQKKLQTWILANVKVLEDIGLWCEDFSVTGTWCHLQSVPPRSNRRFFLP